MKTEEHAEPAAVFLQRVTAAVSELKDQLQQDYERTYPGLGEIKRGIRQELVLQPYRAGLVLRLYRA